MSEVRKDFEIEIDDYNSLCVGCDEVQFPLSFTVEECVEEYCDMRDIELLRIVENCSTGQVRTGEFLYNRESLLEPINTPEALRAISRAAGISVDEFNAVVYRMQGRGYHDY